MNRFSRRNFVKASALTAGALSMGLLQPFKEDAMAISDKAKKYHERMFPGYSSSFLQTDPEFIERFDNFAFDEVVSHDDLDDRTRFMAVLAILLGCQGVDEFRAMLPAALNVGVTPVEAKAVSYTHLTLPTIA